MSNNSQPIIIHAHSEPVPANQQSPEDRVPPRVLTAMHLVEHFTSKTEIKALPIKKGFDDASEWEPLPRIELTDEERDTYNSALRILESYFNGSMRESSLETVERQRQEEREKQARLNGGPVLVIDCPNCGGGQNRYRCLLCRTKGKVIVGMVP